MQKNKISKVEVKLSPLEKNKSVIFFPWRIRELSKVPAGRKRVKSNFTVAGDSIYFPDSAQTTLFVSFFVK